MPLENQTLRRPLIGLALCYGLGTWLGLSFITPIPLLLAAALAAWMGAALGMAAGKGRADGALAGAARVLAGIAVVLTAWLAARVHPLNATATGPAGVADLLGSAVDVEGVVADDPSVVWRGKQADARFALKVERLRAGDGAWAARDARVQVVWRGPREAWVPRYGELWRLKGRVQAWPADDDEPPDRLGRRCHVRADGAASRFLSGGHGAWLPGHCYEARRAAARYLSLGIEDHPESAALLKALLLGYRTQMPRDTKQAFALTGTLHIFAISGSHVVVMAGLIIFVLNALRVSRLYWVLVLAPLLIAYTLGTGMQASAARACLMAIVYWAAPWLGRRPDTLSALAFSALLILAAAPVQLLDLGFILSFAVVLGLILIFPPLNAPVRRRLAPDPLRVQPEGAAVRALRAAGRALGDVAALSVAAWLASAPLTAYCFENLSLVSVPTNLVVVPLSFLSVLAGCLALILGPCVGFLADVFNHANVAVMGLMVWITQQAAHVPYGSFTVPRPPVWWMAAWYGTLGVWLLWNAARGREKDGHGAGGMESSFLAANSEGI